jgi:predicted N-acetyltransferase YhbS
MVAPDCQRQGIGRAVVLRAIQEMRERGVTAFHVDCHPDQARFYAKCGFKICAGGWLDYARLTLTAIDKRQTRTC